MKLAAREEGLLGLVAQYRDDECRRLLANARAEAQALLGRVFAEERAHLHAQVEAERQRARSRAEAVRADRQTRLRQGLERRSARRLAAAWPRLEAALLARWADPGGRRRWAEDHLRLALERLPPPCPHGHWVIRHAPDWSEPERRELIVAMQLGLAHRPRFAAEDDLVAGLTVSCGGTVLDASLAALLCDRLRLEARLLALLAEEARPGGVAGTRKDSPRDGG